MPSKSPAQAKLMRAVANNKKFAKKVGVPQKVGQEFATADQAVAGYQPAKSTVMGGGRGKR